MTYYTTLAPSPVGPLRVLVDERGRLLAIAFGDTPIPEAEESKARCAHVTRQLAEYFRGVRTHFEVELALAGTPFQREVWRALRRIPFGKTISYRQLAERIGRPAAMRAVGQANGRNPVPIVVPCHRVIAADGSLGGYGGGLVLKRRLLELEGVRLGTIGQSA